MPKLKVIAGGPSEKEIQNQILTWLWYQRVDCWQNDSVGIFDVRSGRFRKKGKFFVHGRPDIEGILSPTGKWFGIECKAAKGVVSDAQKEFIYRIQLAGGLIFVARSLDDVIQVMGPYINGTAT